MNINAAGLAIIKTGESCRLNAYLDPAGIATIGWGHTPAKMGTTITQAEADAYLLADTQHAADAVSNLTHDVPTTENQFSAMVSLTFNIGTGAFGQSTVLKAHRLKHYDMAGSAFLMWDKAHVDGQLVVLRGLLRRRQQERALYMTA